MHDPYWAKSQSQTLLPTMLEASAPAPRPTGWRLVGAIATCVAIFLVDLALPGIVVGLLYSLVVVALSRTGRPSWLAVVCTLGTLLHAVAGIFDLPAADLSVVIANRSLAILVLWGIGGWIAFNLAALGSRPSVPWRAVGAD
jgi:hypothetical protein